MTGLKLYKGDITKLKVDAIVNAANSSLLGGGGVDGAIHRSAGPELLAECRSLNGCRTGEAKITKGFKLQAQYVIHTVGPVWYGGLNGEPELLRNCYQNCLSLASGHSIKTIAFPNISTGVYGYPKKEAAEIAINTVKNYLSEHSDIREVSFAVFDEENFFIYKELLK